MFTFFCDIFNGNQANLSVVYFDEQTTETDELTSIRNNKNYYETDSITEAVKYFNLYTENGILKAYTKEEVALDNMGINSEDAPEFREKINLLLQNLDDEEAVENTVLFPKWVAGIEYKKDDKVRYESVLYKVLQPHTSLSTWTPNVAPSLFARVLSEDGQVLPWEQPDSANAYMTGDRVWYNNEMYESLVDNNVWSPEAYPAGWRKVVG
jgi:hypothetical protein